MPGFRSSLRTLAQAVAAGLIVGKPLGIVAFSFFAVRMGLAKLPDRVSWGAVTGGGFLAGIGFTMALFIAGLALTGETLDGAKVGILGASAIAAFIGMTTLNALLPKGEVRIEG
jgi:NhaA family Na+:H+ antiporter